MFPGFGSPLFGGPAPTLPGARVAELASRAATLWRGQTFRVSVPYTATTLRVALFNERMLVCALMIFADTSNAARCVVGNREVQSVVTATSGIAGNTYFQLDAGRSAFIWTTDPDNEFIDVSQFFAAQEIINTTQYLQCTAWAGQRL